MKKLALFAAMFCVIHMFAQDTEILSGGATFNVQNDSLGYKLNFGFNRVPGADPEAGNILWDKIKGSTMWFFDATSVVNIGNETETSEDNIVIDASLAVNQMLKARSGLIFDLLRPSVSSSKSRNSGLLYASPGISYYWLNKSNDKFNFDFTFSYVWDLGNRLQEKAAPNSFTRQKISASIGLNCFKKDFGTTDEFTRLIFETKVTVFSVWGDPQIADGSYGNVGISLAYQPIKSLGFKIGYKKGHQDPMYQKLDVVEFGVVLYQ